MTTVTKIEARKIYLSNGDSFTCPADWKFLLTDKKMKIGMRVTSWHRDYDGRLTYVVKTAEGYDVGAVNIFRGKPGNYQPAL